MPKFDVDVKAFIKISVEAPTADAARKEAERLVESIAPGEFFIKGWNDGTDTGCKIADAGSFDIDGESDVEQLCNSCGDELDGLARDGLCFGCQPELEEPPLDTPSLDTSFHDHEMDVG